jgi:hypothetical protein
VKIGFAMVYSLPLPSLVGRVQRQPQHFYQSTFRNSVKRHLRRQVLGVLVFVSTS